MFLAQLVNLLPLPQSSIACARVDFVRALTKVAEGGGPGTVRFQPQPVARGSCPCADGTSLNCDPSPHQLAIGEPAIAVTLAVAKLWFLCMQSQSPSSELTCACLSRVLEAVGRGDRTTDVRQGTAGPVVM